MLQRETEGKERGGSREGHPASTPLARSRVGRLTPGAGTQKRPGRARRGRAAPQVQGRGALLESGRREEVAGRLEIRSAARVGGGARQGAGSFMNIWRVNAVLREAAKAEDQVPAGM